MTAYVDHIRAAIAALEQELKGDRRYIMYQELRRMLAAYVDSQKMPRATDSRPPSPLPDSQRRMPSREMSPETKEVIERATEFLHDKSEPVPIRDLYNQIVEKDGCRIGGQDPVNGLSAILSRSGRFTAHGRSGWTLKTEEERAAEQREAAIGFYRKADPEYAEVLEQGL
jgi:hypothetical protein